MQRNLTGRKNMAQQIWKFDFNFRRLTFNQLMFWGGASPHTFNLRWCLWCVIAKTVNLLLVHCNSTHTSPAGSVSQSCLSTFCDDSLGQTGSKALGWSETHSCLCTLCDLSWSSWWHCWWLDVFWTNPQKLLNDWRTVGLAEPQCGGEDLKLCV